jgi:hypothetical protein
MNPEHQAAIQQAVQEHLNAAARGALACCDGDAAQAHAMLARLGEDAFAAAQPSTDDRAASSEQGSAQEPVPGEGAANS